MRTSDPRILPFLSAVIGESSATRWRSGEMMVVRLSPDLRACAISRPGCHDPVVQITEDRHLDWLRDLNDLPLVRRTEVWLAKLVLGHPHAWDLIDGAATGDIPRLLLSVANSGIAKAGWGMDDLSRCLLALMPIKPPGIDATVDHIVRAARLKKIGRAPFGDASYEAGEIGPIPLGHTRRGHFALLDRGRGRVALAHADRVLSPQYLERLAPLTFWMEQFGWRGRLNATWAGEALMQVCVGLGRYASTRTSPMEGRGIDCRPSLGR